MRDSNGSASTPTSTASHTRCRAPAVLRRSGIVTMSAVTSSSVAFARNRRSGTVPENGKSIGVMASPSAHAGLADARPQLVDFRIGELRVGHAKHGGHDLLG